jgi:hypothetical protein
MTSIALSQVHMDYSAVSPLHGHQNRPTHDSDYKPEAKLLS